MSRRLGWGLVLFVIGFLGSTAQARDLPVSDSIGLRAALREARPGDRILLAPGDYAGGVYVQDVHGQDGHPIALAAADPAHPPCFVGGTEALHLSDISYVELRDLAVRGQSGNGINVDDAGSFATPAHHVCFERLRIQDTGPRGNHDGLKLSGLDDFVIRDCRFEAWGDGGSAIDMVGCHRGRITGCTFRAREGSGSNAIQSKGGTRDILIRGNRFEQCGGRALNLGGSTGLQFFRPRVEGFEARNLTVEGNVLVGSQAPFAFVGVDGATVRFNTVYLPGRWALRILQETTAEGFLPCRGGVFTDNLIVFRSEQWAEGGCNIGPHTAAETFRFARNFWFCLDRPERSHPTLPTPEENGQYGLDPRFLDAAAGDFRLQADSPAQGCGYTALPPEGEDSGQP